MGILRKRRGQRGKEIKLVRERKGLVDEEKRKQTEMAVMKRSGRVEKLSWPLMIGWCGGGDMSMAARKLLAAANILMVLYPI